MKKIRAVAAMLAVSLSPAFGQYKCTSPTGQVSFQQHPCAAQQKQQTLNLQSLPPTGAGTPAPDYAAQNAELDRKRAIRLAVEERRPMVGMTVEDLQYAMGDASAINRSQTGSSAHDQYIYRRGARTVYVYVHNGLVTSIQDVSSGQTAAVAGKCLSRREIWNLEVEASRIEIRNNEAAQARYRDRIALAKDCS